MGASTPENRVKRQLDRAIKELSKEVNLWRYCPQAGPFGSAGVPDRLVLAGGKLVGIECKADASKQPTPLQRHCMNEIERCGGKCFIVYDKKSIDMAIYYMKEIPDEYL